LVLDHEEDKDEEQPEDGLLQEFGGRDEV
jgi:hypothetical protein